MVKYTLNQNIYPKAKKFIKKVIDYLNENNLTDDVDTCAIDMLTNSYSTYLKAQEIVDEEDLTIVNAQGNIVAHPATKLAKDFMDNKKVSRSGCKSY